MNAAKSDFGSVNKDKNATEDESKAGSKEEVKTAEQKAISAEVLALTNDFNTFSANCAFLC